MNGTSWIWITFAAATFQTFRTASQQRLRKLLSVSAAGFVRYAFGAPLAFIAVLVTRYGFRYQWPAIPARFWVTIAAAGVAQILGTNALIRAFDLRSFAVGTVYAKTEVVLVGVFSAALLGEPLRAFGWVFAAIVMFGVIVLAQKSEVLALGSIVKNANDPAARMGLLAAMCFGLAAVGIRSATKSMTDAPAVFRALIALAVMNTVQTLVHGGYIALRQRSDLGSVVKYWRSSSIVGVLSVCGSAGWAWAMTLQNAARVRTVGQVEILLALVVSRYWLKERHPRRDYWASGLVMVGVLGVMLFG